MKSRRQHIIYNVLEVSHRHEEFIFILVVVNLFVFTMWLEMSLITFRRSVSLFIVNQ